MKSELFKNELKTITSDDIRDFAKVVLDDAPDYFFKVAASSTGKYHPAYALGDGGLMRHTKAVLRIYNYIIGLEQYQTQFDERWIDPEYLEWLHENVNMREPMKTFVNELLKNKTN